MSEKRNGGQKVFYEIQEAWHWVLILISPSLIGVILGAACWFGLGTLGKILAVPLAVGGVVDGFCLAESARRQHGTVAFMSRVTATPELDRPALVRGLESDDSNVVRESLLNLETLGLFPREAEPALEMLLEHVDSRIAERAKRALRLRPT